MGDMCYEGKLTTNVFYLLIPSMTIIFIYIITIMFYTLFTFQDYILHFITTSSAKVIRIS